MAAVGGAGVREWQMVKNPGNRKTRIKQPRISKGYPSRTDALVGILPEPGISSKWETTTRIRRQQSFVFSFRKMELELIVGEPVTEPVTLTRSLFSAYSRRKIRKPDQTTADFEGSSFQNARARGHSSRTGHILEMGDNHPNP